MDDRRVRECALQSRSLVLLRPIEDAVGMILGKHIRAKVIELRYFGELSVTKGPKGFALSLDRIARLQLGWLAFLRNPKSAISTTELAGQPRARELPVAHDALRRDLQDVSSLFDREPTEVAQLHYLRPSWIHLCQRRERIVQRA